MANECNNMVWFYSRDKLLEARGFKVDSMKIQALCRDYNLRIASERNISKPAYIIPINKISDR